ncbi:hypothetical protein XENOCAPTIV_023782 [Xenoophorus captivus]|uniref:Secreted protein n=1 Tax=Xenoophorus captivus TaxID=1517983 RepID=A0ABV0QEA6_9TELE
MLMYVEHFCVVVYFLWVIQCFLFLAAMVTAWEEDSNQYKASAAAQGATCFQDSVSTACVRFLPWWLVFLHLKDFKEDLSLDRCS